MKHGCTGTGIILACLFGLAPEARASSGGFGFGGGAASPASAQIRPNQPPGLGGAGVIGIGKCGGVTGDVTGCRGQPPTGFAGMCGPAGFFGASGCIGSGMTGMCGLSGGCFGSFAQPTQGYSKWAPSPTKAYYHRTLTIQTPPPNETAFEFVLVHYPDRPKFFYYYDPVDKKYFGRYRIGATPTDCFQVLNVPDRKASLKDIKDSSWRNVKGMATIGEFTRPKSGTTIEPTLQNLKLLRPPESIPDDLLGLPAEEPALKKAPDKK